MRIHGTDRRRRDALTLFAIMFLVIVAVCYLWKYLGYYNFAVSREAFQGDKGNIVCFLTVRPNELFYKFVRQLPNQERIYICIDDNNHSIPGYDGVIKLIKLDNEMCENAGFKSTLTSLGPNWEGKAGSRDKALYYFCKNNIDFNHIWFLEDDVFIPTTKTIYNIDEKYKDGDLLVASNDILNKTSEWYWTNYVYTHMLIEEPYAHSMICAIRCSKRLLFHINKYAESHNTLFMDEVLFNTIAMHEKLDIRVIDELKTITWRDTFQKHEINKNNLYHPIKDIKMQYEYRK